MPPILLLIWSDRLYSPCRCCCIRNLKEDSCAASCNQDPCGSWRKSVAAMPQYGIKGETTVTQTSGTISYLQYGKGENRAKELSINAIDNYYLKYLQLLNNTAMKYDIFISYRRKGGSERAELLKAILENRGYKGSRVFMDTHSLLGGDFKKRIKDAISQSVNVIVLITEGCFDNIKDEDYWIFEISEAMALKKNIIPVFFDGIKSINEKNLPLMLTELPYQNSVSYNHEFADAFYSKLCSFLIKDKDYINRIHKTYIFITCAIVTIIAVSTVLYNTYCNDDSKTETECIHVTNGVDLGLPSGTIWSKCNVGANDEYDSGAFYTWGSTTPTEIQKKTTLESSENIIGTSYDAASLALGQEWRLPTEKQLAELISSCKWDWCNKDGQVGYMVTGPNGNSMFLPAAGCIIGGESKYKRQFGYYWTGESNPEDKTLAKELLFGLGEINIESGRKNVGRSIRAVYAKK